MPGGRPRNWRPTAHVVVRTDGSETADAIAAIIADAITTSGVDKLRVAIEVDDRELAQDEIDQLERATRLAPVHR